MASEVKTGSGAGRRAYRSPRRAEQARATRRAIREAATRLFLEHGYAATRITEIASAAEVAPETVYATFKNKRALLKEAIDVAIAGDDEPVPVADRPWLDDVHAEPDPRRRTRMLSDDGFTRPARVARSSKCCAARPRAIRISRAHVGRDAARTARTVAGVRRVGDDRDPESAYDDEQIDIVWALGGPELYTALVVERGWSVEQYVAAMADLVERLRRPRRSLV